MLVHIGQAGRPIEGSCMMHYLHTSSFAGSPGTSRTCTLLMLVKRTWSVNWRMIFFCSSSSKNWAVVVR